MSNCISSRCDTLTDGCCVEPCATSLREWRTGTTPPAQSFGHRLGARWGLPTLPPAYGQKIVLGSTISGDLCKRIASQALYLRS